MAVVVTINGYECRCRFRLLTLGQTCLVSGSDVLVLAGGAKTAWASVIKKDTGMLERAVRMEVDRRATWFVSCQDALRLSTNKLGFRQALASTLVARPGLLIGNRETYSQPASPAQQTALFVECRPDNLEQVILSFRKLSTAALRSCSDSLGHA